MLRKLVTLTKILVIEDEDELRDAIIDILNLEKFQVMSASNGQEGIALAEKEKPDLILCDVMMPELDGYGVISALRQNPELATIPFVFLTAKSEKQDLRQGMKLGADDYLTKPFSRTELLEAIAAQFRKQEAYEHKVQQKLENLRSNITLSLPHELHTPLAGIIGISELMMEDYDILETTDAMEMLENIHSAAERLYRLTQNFLLYAELELTAADPDRVAALRNSRATCEAEVTIALAAHSVADKVLRAPDLKTELQEGTVRISELKLKKIIEEIVDNAFKFSSDRTPVYLTGQLLENSYEIRVTNEGRGLTPEAIQDIGAYMQFERKLYEQQGSGLGLMIAKRLIELHGGTLTIDSIPDQKTTIQISLPL